MKTENEIREEIRRVKELREHYEAGSCIYEAHSNWIAALIWVLS